MPDKVLRIIKFVFAVVLAPIAVAVTKGLFIEMQVLNELRHIFLMGAATYCGLNLFYYPIEGLYLFGQRVFGDMFRFSTATASVVPMVIPIYTTLLLLIHYIIMSIFHYEGLQNYFIFFIGFTFAMHVVMTAHDIYDEDDGQIKAHYLFYFALTYICNIVLLVVLLDFNFSSVKFMSFFDSSYNHAEFIYMWAYRLIV
jgi:hypothetical protein